MSFFHQTIGLLENSLNYSMEKNRVISHNIANVDTPGFKAKDIVFKNVLNEKLAMSTRAKKNHPKHLPFTSGSKLTYKVTSKRNSMYNHNRNNVDIDREMAELAKNQIYYQAMIDRLNGEFRNIQTVIKGGN